MSESVIETIIEMTNAPSIEALWATHTARMAGYGFDRLIYGYTQFRTAHSMGDPNDFLLLTNHSPAYAGPFINDGHYRDAPMVRWALDHEGAASWSITEEAIANGNLTPEQQRVISFNRRHGVTAGYSIGFRSISARAKGAIGLTGRKGLTQADVDAIWARFGREILALNNVAHLKILSLPFPMAGRSLTPRQREALQWVGDGKTTQDIALLMGLTSATVEKHLRLAREALHVETTAQAVLKAAFQNQMFVLEC